MKLLIFLFGLWQSTLTFGYAEKFSNLNKFKSAKQLEQVMIESGGLIILEQVQKEEKLNDIFLITQECTKKNNKLKCKLVRVDGKTK